MMKISVQLFKHKAYEFRWAFLSGILVGTSYIPFPPWALLFCYTPVWLYAVSDKRSIRSIFGAGWITQFTL
ncbi:MAG: apolipoprotein N-acyltransferase, partial [Bdellovibrio sp.]